MGKRISLVDSMDRDKEVLDPVVEQNFLKYGTASAPETGRPEVPRRPSARTVERSPEQEPVRRARPSKVAPVGLIPVTVRLRPEIAGALKRASLERQLSGEELFTQQDIVEQALEPWLRQEGLLS